MHRHTVTICALLVLVGASSQLQPDEALDRARHACKDIAAVSYTLAEEHHSSDGKWLIHCTARQARADVPAIAFTEGIFRFEGTIEQDGKKESFGVAYDGSKLYVVNPGEKNINMIDQPSTADLMGGLDHRLMLLGVPPLSADAPFADSADGRTIIRAGELVGEKAIDKITCDVLKVNIAALAPDGSRHEIESTWAFGKDDHLPRMHDSDFGHTELLSLRVLSAKDIEDRSTFTLRAEPTSQPAHEK